MGEMNYCELKWEQGNKTWLRAELLQTPSDLGVLPEAGPKMRCWACGQHGPEADGAHLNLITEKRPRYAETREWNTKKPILLKYMC